MKNLMAILLLTLPFYAFNQTLSTYSGSGIGGYADGPADQARFLGPEQLAIDKNGNVYVADYNNHVIRKITEDGTVTTFAGTGNIGDTDGQASSAKFNFPIGISFDQNDNLIVSDNLNHKIRMIDTNGIVTTIAGTGIAGFANGPLNEAQFNQPVYNCIDKNGIIYIAESENSRIRKIDLESGMVSTYAGTGVPGYKDGPVAEATFNLPRGIVVDEDLNIFIGDQGNHVIRKISPDGIVSTIAGTGNAGYKDGIGEEAKFNGPKGIDIDSLGNIYVADRLNYVVRKIDPEGNVETVVGKGGLSGYVDGELDSGLLGRATAVKLVNNNCLLISDWEEDVIRKAQFLFSPVSAEFLSFQSFSIFPNPAIDKLVIEGDFGVEFEVTIYTMDGQAIFQEENNRYISVNTLATGAYIIKVISDDFRGVQKLVKK